MNDAWGALVKVALLGTDRAAGRPVVGDAPGQVGLAITALLGDERPPERVLLGAAGLLATARRAGRKPDVPDGPLPAPAPAIDRPQLDERGAEVLASVLSGSWRTVTAEVLELIDESGRRVPAALLPAVLEWGSGNVGARAQVVAAIGERGLWLAAQRPDWAWAVADGEPDLDDAADRWATGTGGERRALLGALRAVDPAAGLALVASTWSTDRGEDRASFVEALAVGLSMADEPLLETALDDRRKEVRRAATALLARLPASRLAARMGDRAAALFVGTQDVRLPDDLPVDWERDGIDRTARFGLGERAWWLCQVVAACPLDRWPTEVAGATNGLELHDALLRGWAVATSRQSDPTWALALLDDPGTPSEARRSLLAVLNPTARAAWIRTVLAGAVRPAQRADALGLVDAVARPWPKDLAQATVAASVRALCDTSPLAGHAARPALLAVAERCAAEDVGAIANTLIAHSAADVRMAADLRRPLTLLQLRADARRALTPPGTVGT